MSSPLKFPSSDTPDADMDDEQTLPAVQKTPLFLASTPSAKGTPSRRDDLSGSPAAAMSGIMAKRAVGMSTPKRKTPLFARKYPSCVNLVVVSHTVI